jgi:Ser/Thr protein kinase RdoA (MazF antagonist)
MEATEEQLTETAGAALDRWDLDVRDVALASRSENVVFKVTTPQTDYALRLHRPGYNTLAELQAEIAWTDALRASGIHVPRHLPTRDDRAYAEVTLAGTTTRVQAGMIEWIDGASLGTSLETATLAETVDCFDQLGAVIAATHNQATQWSPPEGFVRRRWDADGLVGPDPLWGRFWEIPELEGPDRNVLLEARDRLHETLSAYGCPADEFSMIHADLHPYNVLVDDSTVQVIDFDDCGYGWHAYDLAVASYNYRENERFDDIERALIDGYHSVRPLSDKAIGLLPAFYLVRSLISLGWINARPELSETSKVQRLAAATVATARRYLDQRIET